MSYVALYRKFRPQTFDDVKGQDHIVKTFTNQINAGRLGHAYLFCGTRGTGKTSVAKIVAKAVNCEHPVNGSPCCECPTCRAIANGSSMNVMEIDAASNNGVDNIRELRESVTYPPTEGRYKVYIIDEVHMLSSGAFNALLKTLEEPPEYVIFILATTEVHKIPITILSRCQRYDFKRITADVLRDRLVELTQKEGVNAEEKALAYIAKAADGSMRDALSLLDQCIAFYLNDELTYDHVLEVLGAVDTDVFRRIFKGAIDGDASTLLREINRAVDEGRDLSQFVSEFIWYLRNLMIVKSGADVDELLEMSEENIARIKEDAAEAELDTIIRYIRTFSDLENKLRYSTNKRIDIEIAVIKLCKPQMDNSFEALTDRMSQLEKDMQNMPAQTIVREVVAEGAAESKPKPEIKIPDAIPEDIEAVIKNWNAIKRDFPGGTYQCMQRAYPAIGNNGELLLVFDDSLAHDFIAKKEILDRLIHIIESHVNKHIEVKLELNNTGYPASSYLPDLTELINADIEVEE